MMKFDRYTCDWAKNIITRCFGKIPKSNYHKIPLLLKSAARSVRMYSVLCRCTSARFFSTIDIPASSNGGRTSSWWWCWMTSSSWCSRSWTCANGASTSPDHSDPCDAWIVALMASLNHAHLAARLALHVALLLDARLHKSSVDYIIDCRLHRLSVLKIKGNRVSGELRKHVVDLLRPLTDCLIRGESYLEGDYRNLHRSTVHFREFSSAPCLRWRAPSCASLRHSTTAAIAHNEVRQSGRNDWNSPISSAPSAGRRALGHLELINQSINQPPTAGSLVGGNGARANGRRHVGQVESCSIHERRHQLRGWQ